MPINLREIAVLHRRGRAVDYGEGTPEIPEFNRTIWCQLTRGPENDLTVICRWHDLRGVTAVIGTTAREGSDFSIKFSDDVQYQIQGIRPVDENPRQYAELRVSAISSRLPFTNEDLE